MTSILNLGLERPEAANPIHLRRTGSVAMCFCVWNEDIVIKSKLCLYEVVH
jgi:hypothetical protein